MVRVFAVVLLACVLPVGGGVLGEEPPPSNHDQAATELLRLAGLERTMAGGATAMIDAQILANPNMAPYRDVMLEWAGKYMKWETISPEPIKIYKEAFSESELREIIAFYQTPTGQKALAKMPELMQKGAAVGVTIAQAHAAELERMVLERKKQLEAGEQKP